MANKSIADVFADYREDALRQKHLYESACAGDERLAAVRRELREKALLLMEGAFSGGEELPDEELMRLEAAELELLARVGRKRFLCETCGDTGAAGGKPCNCLLQRIYRECYGARDIAKLDASFEKIDFARIDDEAALKNGRTQRKWMELFARACRDYIDKFPRTDTQNILMTGKAGLGKSFLLQCMAARAAARGIDAMLIRANELFGVFFAHRMGDEADLSYLYKADLMLIDDIGTEPVTQNVSNEYFYELVARRLDGGRHTVFATNVEDLQKRYDDRIASRLKSREDTLWLKFEGRDLRV